MSERLEILQIIGELNTPEFAKPLKFYAYGSGGRLHSREGCGSRRQRWDSKATEREIPLRTAVKKSKKLCERCLHNLPLTSTQEDVYDRAKLLAEIAPKVAALDGLVNDKKEMEHIVNWPNLLRWHNRYIRAELHQQLTAIDADNGLRAWHGNLLQGVAEHVFGEVVTTQLESEVLRLAAIEVFMNQLEQPGTRTAVSGMDENFTETIHDSFGFYATRQSEGSQASRSELRHIRAISKTWTKLMHTGMSAEIAAETILTDKDMLVQAIGEPNSVGSRFCDTANKPNDGENTWDYACRRWYEHMHGVATRALHTWTTYYNALLANTKPVLISCERFRCDSAKDWASGDTPEQLIASTLNWIIETGNYIARSALICHPVIAAYVQKTGYQFGAGSSGKPIRLDTLPTEADIRSALTLWTTGEDEDGAVYRKFADALTAIQML